MKTTYEIGEWKGNPVFKVWKADEEGNKIGEYPIVSLGKKKLEALLNHANAAIGFAERSNDTEEDKL